MRIIAMRIIGLVLALAALSAGSALAGPIGAAGGDAGVEVVVDGHEFVFKADREGRIVVENFSVEHEGVLLAQFSIDALLNPDPFITYGIGVIDFGAPSEFGFLFGTPIVPVGPTSVVEASIGGELTDFEGNGVSISPVLATVQSSRAKFPAISMGVDVGPALIAGPGAPDAAYAYGPFLVPPQAGPAGTFTFMEVLSLFTLSGGSDEAQLNGFTSINNQPGSRVPEPSSLSLLAIGLGGAIWARRRRR